MKRYRLIVLICIVLLVLLIGSSTVLAQMRRVTLGTGTPASCSALALQEELSVGGDLTLDFNCGPRAHTITVTTPLRINGNVIINAGWRVRFSGGGTSQLFYVSGSLDLSQTILMNGYGVGSDGSIGTTGGAIAAFDSDVRLSNVLLMLNRATVGGALAAQNSTITIRNSTFISNQAELVGGAFHVSDSVVTIQNTTFQSNRAPDVNGDGGAFYQYGGSLGLEDVRFHRNQAGRNGGGAYLFDLASLDIRNGTVQDNTAVTTGGGLLIADTNTTIENTSFTRNQAGDAGGLNFYTNSSAGKSLTVSNSHFSRNQATDATGSGGAIQAGAYTTVTISSSEFRENSATINGGAIAANGPSLSVSDTEFRNNTASTTDSGGSIVRAYGPVTSSFSNVQFTNNTARYSLFNNGISTVTDSLFSGNSGTLGSGGQLTVVGGEFFFNPNGGIFASGNSLTVRDSNFLFNGNLSTEGRGTPAGAIFIGGVNTALIQQSRFIANQGTVGAIHTGRSNTTIENSLFMRNSSGTVGTVFNLSDATSILRIVHSTFKNNRNGGVTNGPSGSATLANSVIEGPVYTCRGPWIFSGYNVQFGSEGCAGVEDFDPLLGLNGVPQPGSLLINAAESAFCLPNDLDGTARPQGGQCDVGAFELSIASAPIVIVTPLPTFTPEPTATLIPVPTLPPPTPRPQFDCSGFKPTSPLDGLPNGLATFYWDPAQGATDYRILIFNEQNTLVAAFSVIGQTTLQGDLSTGAVGPGLTFTWQVEALRNGQIVCSAPGVTLFRESVPPPPPQPTAAPQCGNGIQEPGETPNTCPNGY
ncbi:MAG: hypothetical protein J0M33_04755 [Anaerolineae bacterium]|nr:hypothetical protein [Anaerolineae bacterium]